MLSKRIIACLDVRDGQVVKGVNFEELRAAGDPAELARRYNAEGIDELVILDITATLEARRALADTIRAVARELFIPLAVGGGIRSEADAAAAVEAGADKLSVNTWALANPGIITPWSSRSMRSARIRFPRPAKNASPCTLAAAGRPSIAAPWNGRAKPNRAAPARSS